MTFSPLTSRTVGTRNYSSRKGARVTQLIIHYTAGGTDESNVRLLSQSHLYGRQASCHYVLQRNGQLVGIVPEEYRAWTSGSQAADGPSITVETVIAPKGQATAAQMETLAKLAADLSQRYGWGALTRKNIRGHREFQSTDCPGPYLWPRMDQIVARANQIRTGVKTSTAKKASTTTTKKTTSTAGKAWPAVALPATAKHTAASHNAWVKLLSDVGYKDKSLTVAMQKWLRDLGYYKGVIDGVFGPVTVRALQTFLRAKGLYGRAYLIDGVRGPVTIRGEIAYLNSQRQYY